MGKSKNGTSMKKTLGLMGVSMNAMALIAPGAFLWLNYQAQAAQVLIAECGLDMTVFPTVGHSRPGLAPAPAPREGSPLRRPEA